MFWVKIESGPNEVDVEEIYSQRVDDLDVWAVVAAVNQGEVLADKEKRSSVEQHLLANIEAAKQDRNAVRLRRAETEYSEWRRGTFDPALAYRPALSDYFLERQRTHVERAENEGRDETSQND